MRLLHRNFSNKQSCQLLTFSVIAFLPLFLSNNTLYIVIKILLNITHVFPFESLFVCKAVLLKFMQGWCLGSYISPLLFRSPFPTEEWYDEGMCPCAAASVVSDSLRPHGLWPTRLLCPWDFPGRILAWVAVSSSRGSAQPGDRNCISCISCVGRWILDNRATWEALMKWLVK